LLALTVRPRLVAVDHPASVDAGTRRHRGMALNAYLSLIGEHLGPIKGSVIQKGREQSILVVASEHEIATSFDERTGLSTGKVVHHPIRVSKGIDRSTPLLYQALISNEIFSSWQLKFWAATTGGSVGSGQEVQYFTIALIGARIESIDLVKPNTTDRRTAGLPDREEVAFVYETVQWIWNEGGITATADWSPVA
jgi:type VI secretion system secreted protein Hcp